MHAHVPRLARCILIALALGVVTLTASLSAQPEPQRKKRGKRWAEMDYGPTLTASIEAPRPARNFAYKGIAIRLGGEKWEADPATVIFDTDLLRYSAGWTGGFVDWRNIAFDGSHNTHMKIVGHQVFGNAQIPGWADEKGSFDDPRKLPYGPLPRAWAHHEGLYLHGDQVVLSYSVGRARVLELPGLERRDGLTVFTRTLEIDSAERPSILQVCDGTGSELSTRSGAAEATDENAVLAKPEGGDGGILAIACAGAPAASLWELSNSTVRLKLPASATTLRLRISIAELPGAATPFRSTGPRDLSALTRGGPARWKEKLVTKGKRGSDDDAYTVDEITVPAENPWQSWMRLGGFDFFSDDSRAAVCTWMGDVWIVEGLDEDLDSLSWQRIATGLFQPLGMKIVDDRIYVLGRDQITRLRDLDGDGETDFYENFNNDAEVTEHFHEFAMDLQTDEKGDFYYARGGRHAKDAVVPHHGTILRVSKDGSTTEIVASGFRAPNGLCVNPDGTFLTTDQEGHWTPMNRINWVRRDGFYGYMWSFYKGERRQDTDYDKPLCWIHKEFNRSPAEPLWVNSDRWGPLGGRLLSISYGTGYVHLVPHETVNGQVQGGVLRLPIPMFPTGVMRGRFRPTDGQLYLCGLFGWSSNRTLPGGFYRVRYTGKTVHVPLELHATRSGIFLKFTAPLDPQRAADARRYSIERWNYKRQQQYGSKDYRVSDAGVGRDRVTIKSARLSRDGLWVWLEIEDMRPCQQMKITCRITAADGSAVRQDIYNTIHELGDDAPYAAAFE